MTKPLSLRGLERFPFFCVAALFAIGCGRTDIQIRHPLSTGEIEANTIVREHHPTEDHFGLPRGALNDEAHLTSVNEREICFAATLRETDPIDFTEMRARLDSSTGPRIEGPRLEGAQVQVKTYQGKIPQRRHTGETSSCTSHDRDGNCQEVTTAPTYSTVFIPGVVQIYEASGKMCFPNSGVVTQETNRVVLEVELRRRAPATQTSPWSVGSSSKEVEFRWGFRADGNASSTAAATPVRSDVD